MMDKMTRTQTLAVTIQKRIADDIQSGRLSPGTRLEEKDLAARYNVSRTPVREALRQLAATGTVEFRPRHGVFIADLSRHRWREILEVTAEMEAATARYAAERMAEAELQALAAQHRRMKPAVDACNGAEFDKQNVVLHGLIHAGAKNAVLFKSIEQMRARSLPYTRAEFMPRQDVILLSFNEHESVIQAIASRQPELAFHAMRAHVFRAGLVEEEPQSRHEAA